MMKTLHGLRILVADDDYIVAHETCRSLLSAGALVCGPVATCADAARALVEQPLDAALVKATLRDGSTRALVDDIVRRRLPIVLTPSAFRTAGADVSHARNVLLLATGGETVRALRRAVDAHAGREADAALGEGLATA